MVSVISATTKSSDIKKAILRDYLQFNLIHLTVPNNTISIGEDLVGCVLRQESFVKNEHNQLGTFNYSSRKIGNLIGKISKVFPDVN